MSYRRTFRIVTDNVVRDSAMELRIIEQNVESGFMILMAVGGILVFLAILW